MTHALILSGYGLNCETETAHAFAYNGATTQIIHINDLMDTPELLNDAQILCVPGGFSYGDDTGSGNAYANKLKLRLMDKLQAFVARDTLTLGICNGCQILTRLGLVPGAKAYDDGISVAVIHNASNRYQCRWVDVAVSGNSPWLQGIERMHIPIAHGEGNIVLDAKSKAYAEQHQLIALRYITQDGAPANGEFPHNPNGAMDDMAALTDTTGRVLAMMPHPERGMFFTQRDDWPKQKAQLTRAGKPLPETSDGMKLFQNAVTYFC